MVNLLGKVIKHKRNMDVAFEVLTCEEDGELLILFVDTLNQGYRKTWKIGVQLDMILNKQDLKDWLYCTEPEAQCIRYVEWRTL